MEQSFLYEDDKSLSSIKATFIHIIPVNLFPKHANKSSEVVIYV